MEDKDIINVTPRVVSKRSSRGLKAFKTEAGNVFLKKEKVSNNYYYNPVTDNRQTNDNRRYYNNVTKSKEGFFSSFMRDMPGLLGDTAKSTGGVLTVVFMFLPNALFGGLWHEIKQLSKKNREKRRRKKINDMLNELY